MNDMSKREYIALQIINGACAGDWKIDVPTGMKWENIIALRAFEIADAFIEVAEGRVVINPKPVEPIVVDQVQE
jgi:hypothetical protein